MFLWTSLFLPLLAPAMGDLDLDLVVGSISDCIVFITDRGLATGGCNGVNVTGVSMGLVWGLAMGEGCTMSLCGL